MGLFRKNCYTNRCEQSHVYHYSSKPPPPLTVTEPSLRKVIAEDWSAPNPNPGKFTIKRVESFRNNTDVFLVAEIFYVGCTNFEGNKICVFQGVSREELLAKRYLDPHFSESSSSPIARFKPDENGWTNARMFAKMLL